MEELKEENFIPVQSAPLHKEICFVLVGGAKVSAVECGRAEKAMYNPELMRLDRCHNTALNVWFPYDEQGAH